MGTFVTYLSFCYITREKVMDKTINFSNNLMFVEVTPACENTNSATFFSNTLLPNLVGRVEAPESLKTCM